MPTAQRRMEIGMPMPVKTVPAEQRTHVSYCLTVVGVHHRPTEILRGALGSAGGKLVAPAKNVSHCINRGHEICLPGPECNHV